MKEERSGSWRNNVFEWTIVFACSSLLSLLAIACVTTEETNRRQLNFIPDAQMNAMGLQAYDEMLHKNKLSKNDKLSEVIKRVGKAIADASGQNYKWEFTLFDEAKTVNAFCLPGGKVGVYTGILPIAANEAGLAAIMGHEVAHAVLRHGAERVSQTMVIQLGVAAASLSFANSKYKNTIAGALGIGLQFGVMLPYSRTHESEADKVGLKYMAVAGFDPNEAPLLWERMDKAGGARVPEVVSTHPDPKRRAEALRAEVAQVSAIYAASAKKPSSKIIY